MLDPINLTVASMQIDMRRMDIIANNAANALTPGFKREILAVTGGLGLTGSKTDVTAQQAGAQLPSITTDQSPGTPQKTSTPLDIAILGEGYMEVQTDQGLAYTRHGALRLDERGRLVTQAGHPVLGQTGEITISSPTPIIEQDGTVIDQGNTVGKIKIVTFERAEQLLSAGNALLVPRDGTTANETSRPRIQQGHLEGSNVDSAREMITLLQTFRHFESSHRSLQAYDEVRDKTFRNLGQF
jgi:flagellar basal-body rod protein FlgG